MRLQTFLNKNSIKLSPVSKKLCLQAIDIMKNGIDPFHDDKHIEEILENLNYLINKTKSIKSKVNFEILLLSICWHDVWSSKRKVNYLLQLIINQSLEGWGSAFMFRTAAKNLGLDKKLTRQVFYVIRKHASVQIIPAYTFEAKILIDLDKLEMWNRYRFFRKGENLILGEVKFFNRIWVRIYYSLIARQKLYFEKLEKLFRKKTRVFTKLIQQQLTKT